MTTELPVSSVPIPTNLLSLVELLAYRAQQQPHQVGYQYLRRGEIVEDTLTYQALHKRAQTVARHLKQVGATSGRALLLFSPGLDFVAAFFGCLYAGVTAVPAYPPRKNRTILRLQAIVKDADATVVLTTSDLSHKVSGWFNLDSPLGQVPWLAIDTLATNAPTEESPKGDFTHNSLAFLQYTSGSTGAPKGVMVSQQNILHNLAAIYRCFGHSDPDSRGFIWLPPYHDMGLIGGILQPLYGGFPVTLMAPVDFLQKPLRWLEGISRHRATTSGGPDFAYELCVRKAEGLRDREGNLDSLQGMDLSRWQVAFTGAEPVRSETLSQFTQMFAPFGFRPEAFYPCYGMAETTLIVSGGSKVSAPVVEKVEAESLKKNRVKQARKEDPLAYAVVGCGQSLHDQKVIVVDPDTKQPCSTGSVGEIWVAGKSVAEGYWQKTEQTLKTFRAFLADTGDGPFLRTGDLGFLQDGELFVTGRIKDVMIIRGQNYYPQDIERSLEKAHPAIKANGSAAFSIKQKGAERLVTVSEIERTYLRRLDVKAVSGCIRTAIAADHSLQICATLLVKPGSIPKTSSGKIQRYRCRDLFLSGELAAVQEWSEDPKHKSEFIKIQSEVSSLLQVVSSRSSARQ